MGKTDRHLGCCQKAAGFLTAPSFGMGDVLRLFRSRSVY